MNKYYFLLYTYFLLYFIILLPIARFPSVEKESVCTLIFLIFPPIIPFFIRVMMVTIAPIATTQAITIPAIAPPDSEQYDFLNFIK